MALARQSNPNIGKTTSAPGSRSAFLTPQSGLAEIVEALLARLLEQDVDLRLNSEVVSLKTVESTYQIQLADGEHITADGVILASPAFASGAILAELDQELSALLREIPYVSTATVSLAYDQQDLTRPLDGYGYVIPRREGRRALACTWTSTKFPHRAPQGKVLVRVFIGRAGQEDSIHWDVDELEKIARDEVAQTLGINVAPRLSRVYMWEKAMPQYNLGHPARLEAIAAQLHKYPGLALAGNGYRGIGIPDCIHSGETAANQLLSL
jgi:protoporphyrinogen/coproporphyrinogen III oxidase